MLFSRWLIWASLLLAWATSVSAAPTTGWLSTEQHPEAQVRLSLTGQRHDDGRLSALLEVRLDGDWKTYWRSPGEGGVAPAMDWSGSRNLERVRWRWPAPERFDLMGIDTVGYRGQVGFPLEIHPERADQPMRLQGRFTLSSCTDICVLTDYDLTLDVDPDSLQPLDEQLHVYNQALSQVPRALPGIEVTSLAWDESSGYLRATLERPAGWSRPDVLLDGDFPGADETLFQKPQITVHGTTLTALFQPEFWAEAPDWVGETLSLTLLDQSLAAKYPVTLEAASAPIAPEAGLALWQIIGVALLGGLILNAMPCVLPVLGLKLHSLVGASGRDRRQVRGQFLASALGILVSFWLLAAFLLVLKLTGGALGWGIQFQSPWFIGLLTVVTWLFALNLLGLFELRLPGGLGNWMAQRGGHSLWGHFVQGVFATFLATPCTAPFLGTAVAFALGANALQLLTTFTALAVGMAVPWLAIALWPGVVRWLPGPGPWMHWLKVLFGALMGATSVWLLSLWMNFLSAFALVLVLLILALPALWLVYRRKGGRALGVTLAAGLPSLLGVGLLGSLALGHWGQPLPEDHAWETFEREAIAPAVADGQTVFVDVTADWCITCQANKLGVLRQEPVYSALGESDIRRLRADWTRPDERISAYLKAQGQYGVPFNRVYGPGAPEGIDLPTVLTADQVLAALAQAGDQSESGGAP
ncbi:protein-disulfide reductase DsbD family protein [Marinimicrobium koreense]|uniref:protein-disulfide reductase DsbD family protein n=1 Tax=Marinimicrobium koreense TaxID=306545 RepID=UPI003F72FE42